MENKSRHNLCINFRAKFRNLATFIKYHYDHKILKYSEQIKFQCKVFQKAGVKRKLFLNIENVQHNILNDITITILI